MDIDDDGDKPMQVIGGGEAKPAADEVFDIDDSDDDDNAFAQPVEEAK